MRRAHVAYHASTDYWPHSTSNAHIEPEHTRAPPLLSFSRHDYIAPKPLDARPSRTCASSKAKKCRMLWLEHISNFARFCMLCCAFFVQHASTSEAMPMGMRGLIPRERQAWKKFIRPIVKDGSSRLRYRMSYRDFKDPHAILHKRREKDEARGLGRNGTVAGEWALAGTLR